LQTGPRTRDSAPMPQAIFVDKPGDPSVLSLRAHDPGAPQAGDVRVAIEVAGVNFIDTYQRSGLYPKPTPFVLGLEGAGRIEALGPGVTGWQVGQRVAWATVAGSYAERVLVKAEQLIAVPDQLDTELAAALMLQGMTAHILATEVHATKPGDTVLVHAAAGGTGQLLVQELKRAGARVIATCSSSKVELALQAGADHVIRYDSEDIVAGVKQHNQGRGVDVVYDSVGKTTFDASLASLRPRGLLVLFGGASGPVPQFDIQRLNQHGSLYLTRPSLYHFISTRAELEKHAGAVLTAAASGKLRARIAERYPLSAAAQAHRDLEGRKSTGKLLLLPGS
jgi:NADPH:quinone reductase